MIWACRRWFRRISRPRPGTSPFSRNLDAHCVSQSFPVEPAKRPVDVILVIANSGSMTDVILGVERNLNGSFAALLAQEKPDRVCPDTCAVVRHDGAGKLRLLIDCLWI